MTITVLSRAQAIRYAYPRLAAIISIRAPHSAKTQIPEHVRRLNVVFSDAVPTPDGPKMRIHPKHRHIGTEQDYECEVREIALFMEKHAQAIRTFVEEHFAVPGSVSTGCDGMVMPLFIHCLGGISRSTAVAQALGEWLDVPVTYNNEVDPNPHVLKVLRDHLQWGQGLGAAA